METGLEDAGGGFVAARFGVWEAAGIADGKVAGAGCGVNEGKEMDAAQPASALCIGSGIAGRDRLISKNGPQDQGSIHLPSPFFRILKESL